MIDPSKTYKTKDGCPVRIYAVDGADSFPIHGAYFSVGSWWPAAWNPSGIYGFVINTETHLDLVEVSPYEDFKIDEPVMVSDTENGVCFKSYFAGVNSKGTPMTWEHGATSWTTNAQSTWNYCRRPTPEELLPSS